MKIRDVMATAAKEFNIFATSENLGCLKNILTPDPKKYILVRQQEDIVKLFNSCKLAWEILKIEATAANQLPKITLADLDCNEKFVILAEDSQISMLQDRFITDIAVVVNDKNEPVGIIDHLKTIKNVLLRIEDSYAETKETLIEYKKIFECIEEEIFVTDQNGLVLRVNPATEKLMGVPAELLVGKNVRQLVDEGIYSTSITLKSLQEKKKIDGMIEYKKTGKRVLVTIFPVFDEKGEIIRTVSTSKDVVELNRLRDELEDKNSELARKNQELNVLRDEIFSQVNFISKSPEMKAIKQTIMKIAPMDLAILIQGESGVGKEVVAKSFHHISPRKNHPFIKINCGLIPENLFESELFGYEGGAFTGASKEGKIGKIELANRGTLFLDEIGEMPLNIQVKLLEFLQDKEICRVGGTKKIKIDTRVIAATNRDLQKMVNEKTFRQDLFYRLNVIPVNIPPLRERIKDIPALVHFFMNKINIKYNITKKLHPEAMDAFISYEWPGNVRELEHNLERLMIINESDVITAESFNSILELKPFSRGKVICTGLMPLKLAKQEVEELLVRRAYEIHKSTYKAAAALSVDQSTVVKILKKYNHAGNENNH